MLEGRTIFRSSQIQSESHESKALMKPSRALSSLSLKEKEPKEGMPLKNRCKSLKPAPHPRAWTHGHTHGRAPMHGFRPLQHGRAVAMHGHASLQLFPLALLGLRLTSILLLIPLECYVFHQNPKVLPKSTNKLQYKHNYIKGG